MSSTGISLHPHAGRFSAAGLAIVVGLHVVLVAALIAMAPELLPPAARILSVSLLTPRPDSPPTPEIVPPRPKPVERRPAPTVPVQQLAAPVESPAASPAAVPVQPPAPPAPPTANVAPLAAPVQPPRFDAEYLDNPKPAYPALSRRLSEQGRVLLRVHVDAEGRAVEVEVQTSSGHARLDDAALAAVRRWKFVPARRGTEPVAAWVRVPIEFTLKE